MRGEGEADDVFALDGDDASAGAGLLVRGEFEGGRDGEGVELTAGGVEEGFGVGELLDRDATRVKGTGGRERAGGGDAEADCVARDVETAAREEEDLAVAVGGD